MNVRVIRDAENNYWRNDCNTIGEKVNGSEVWCMIRKMGGFRINSGIPVLNNGERIAVTNTDKAEMFVKVYSNISEERKISREQGIKKHPNIRMEKRPSNEHLDVESSLN